MRLNAKDVTACIPTRGNVPMQRIVDSLIFDRVIIWDNKRRDRDLAVAGRYAAAAEADTETVYFQDDDVIVPPAAQRALLVNFQPGELISNMEDWRNRDDYQRLVWQAFGCIVERSVIDEAQRKWTDAGGDTDSLEYRMVGCDVVVGVLAPHRRIDAGREHLQYAYGRDRVYKQPDFQNWKRRFYDDACALAGPVKLNLGSGDHPLDGFVNLDASNGWRYEHGLGRFADGTVEAITISHSLMYVPLDEWPAVFAELARVLEPGGVIRITEDSTADPASERFGGWEDAMTLTSPDLVAEHMAAAGLEPELVAPDETRYQDASLIQRFHGDPPKVFFAEGVKDD